MARAAVCGTAAWLLALMLGACGGASPSRGASARPTFSVNVNVKSTPDPPAADTATSGTHSFATGTQATVTSPVARPARTPSLHHLQAVLVHDEHALGPGVGVAVEDLGTGQMLFSHDVHTRRAPASLEKLYTSAATLWTLGPNYRIPTEVYGTGHLGHGGIWYGNLYLRGDGDPTFGDGGWNKVYEQGEGPTADQLIADLRAQGIKRVDGLIYGDASRFDSAAGGPMTHNAPDPGDYGGELSALVYDHGMISGRLGPAASAVHEVALSARLSGFGLVAATKPARTPHGAELLVKLYSPTLSVMLGLMDRPSDDLFADLFAKQLGYRVFGRGTLSLGALAIRQAIGTHYHLDPEIFDGSGLDKADRSSPAELLALLRGMYETSVGRVLRGALPVVGRSGTVAGVGVKTPAAGRCEAKTGTLDNVTNLAGYCAARGGHTIAFVFMVDGPANWTSLATFTPMVGAVAGY